MDFTETQEQRALRDAVAELGKRYGHDYAAPRARARQPLTELWAEAGRSGFVGLTLPEEYGGGGAVMYELGLTAEELSAAGCGLLMLVVSPAINGTIIAKYGTSEQKRHWLPGLCSGETIEAVIVQAADALSGARPGARGESLEQYVKRLRDLEQIAMRHDGVDRVYAMQAGREIRVMVAPGAIDDDAATMLSYEIAREIEKQLEYPGQIKVTVIRESRAIEYAR